MELLDEKMIVVTDTLQVDSFWVLKSQETKDSLFVTFRQPSKGIDLSTSLFSVQNAKFAAPSLETLAKQVMDRNPAKLILEHPDILVSSGLASANAVLEWIDYISKDRRLIVSLCVHPGLVKSTLPIMKSTSRFITSLLHKSHLQLNLSALTTGHSFEYNGTIESIPGPHGACKKSEMWLFKVEKSSVVLTSR